jgi:hypothetical protein
MLAARAGLVPGLPLMYPAFYIRPARVEEAAALSDLCFRSKAGWGYDPEFMALMLAALGVAGEDIAAGDVWVASSCCTTTQSSTPARLMRIGQRSSASATCCAYGSPPPVGKAKNHNPNYVVIVSPGRNSSG